MSEDIYAVLKLSRNATDAEIKKAYRQLARKFHPDVNKDAGAEKKFKEIQRAYSILSDSQKKAQYDQFGVTDDSPGQGGAGFEGFGGFSDSFDDIFDSFFGGSRRRQKSGPRQGEDLRYDLELTLEDVAEGLSKEIEIFHLESCARCSGSGSQPGTSKATCAPCQGSGQLKTVQRTLLGSFSQVSVCYHCEGVGQVIKHPCLVCHGKGLEKKKKKIKVDIPAGVERGTRLRISGEGNRGEGNGAAGDLYVFMTVKEHEYFSREGDDVYLEIEIPLTQAALGTEIEVPILGGHAKLKVPEATQPGTVFRLKGKGVPHLRSFGKGDHYVKVKVSLPKKLSAKEKELLRELAEIRGEISVPKDSMSYVKARR